MTASTRVDEFEELRPHLLAVAYRLTGTFADAEDIVQDAWLRWDGAAHDAIVDLRAWLTTVVSRLGLDRLRSAATGGKPMLGEWLPEPVVTALGRLPIRCRRWWPARTPGSRRWWCWSGSTPISGWPSCCTTDSAVPFGEIAEVLGVSAAAARQLASRARRAVASAPPPAADDTHDEVAGALMAALAAGDMDAVVRLLHPDVTFTGDANRRAPHRRPRHPRPGQGGAVPVRAGRPVRAGMAGVEPARAGQRPARQPTRRARRRRDGYPAHDAAGHRDDRARRKGLRRMGYRQPGQVHRLAAASWSSVAHGTRHASPELKPCSVMPSAEYMRGAHVLHADLIGQLDHAVVTETAPQIGDLLVGDGVRVGGHGVGVGDRGALVIGVRAVRSRSRRCP